MSFWKKDDPKASASLESVDSPVSEALILVCEKCGKKQASSPEDNPSRAIQLQLKETIRAEGAKGQLRCVLTSCMDVCPEGGIAVGISRPERGDRFFVATGETESAARAIWEKARQK